MLPVRLLQLLCILCGFHGTSAGRNALCASLILSIDLQRSVMAFYVNYLKARTPFDEEKLLEKLPDGMRLSLMKEMYKDVTAPVPFLQGLADDVLAEIYVLMKPMTAMPTQLICRDDDDTQVWAPSSIGGCVVRSWLAV